MKLKNTLCPVLLGATLATEGVALGINPKNIPKKLTKITITLKNNTMPLAVVTAGLPLTIDAIIGGNLLTAIGMSVLTGTNAVRLIIAHDKKITIITLYAR
jgi:hypothetical protein